MIPPSLGPQRAHNKTAWGDHHHFRTHLAVTEYLTGRTRGGRLGECWRNPKQIAEAKKGGEDGGRIGEAPLVILLAVVVEFEWR